MAPRQVPGHALPDGPVRRHRRRDRRRDRAEVQTLGQRRAAPERPGQGPDLRHPRADRDHLARASRCCPATSSPPAPRPASASASTRRSSWSPATSSRSRSPASARCATASPDRPCSPRHETCGRSSCATSTARNWPSRSTGSGPPVAAGARPGRHLELLPGPGPGPGRPVPGDPGRLRRGRPLPGRPDGISIDRARRRPGRPAGRSSASTPAPPSSATRWARWWCGAWPPATRTRCPRWSCSARSREPADAGRQAQRDRARRAAREGHRSGRPGRGGQRPVRDHPAGQARGAAFVRELIMRQDPEGYARNCEALAAATDPGPVDPGLPLLLITGGDDKVGPPEASQEHRRRARLRPPWRSCPASGTGPRWKPPAPSPTCSRSSSRLSRTYPASRPDAAGRHRHARPAPRQDPLPQRLHPRLHRRRPLPR